MGAMVRSELTFSVQILDEEGKLSQIFIFTLLCGASKGFMKAFKAHVHEIDSVRK